MHFGIMSMQMDRLVAGIDRPAMGEVLSGRIDLPTLVRGLADAGFQTIELGGDLQLFFPDVFEAGTIQQLLELRYERALMYTVHLPLWSVEPSTPLAPVRAGSVHAIVETIASTLPLTPAAYVLHATGALAAEFTRMPLPESVHSAILDYFAEQADRSIRQILSQTGVASRLLAVETIEFPFNATVTLAEQNDLGICFDTGHVLTGFSGEIDLFTALERCLPRLAEVHLHDAPAFHRTGRLGYGEDHRPLGQGDLDSARFIDRLREAEFDGPVIFELSVEEAQASLAHLRQLRPDLHVR